MSPTPEGLLSLQWLSEGQTEASLSQRAEDGKTELSLMRFSLAHPQWQPPGHSSKFLGHLRGRVQQDAAAWGAPSTRSPPTPGVLSDCTSPLVSPILPTLCPSHPSYLPGIADLVRNPGSQAQPITSHALLWTLLLSLPPLFGSLFFSQKPSWPTSW